MIEILHRYTKAVLYKAEAAESVKDAVAEAVRSDANLGGADLRGANLGDANLRGANLRGANLYDANLYDADLGGADLRGANLRGADLRGADLYGANLRGADLRGADLYGANLRGADLGGADLGDLRNSMLGGDAPDAIELRAKVAAHIEAHPELHDQSEWGDGKPDPTCGTPCCVAGWACHLGGGDRGLGVATAATLLLTAPGVDNPSFDAGVSREEILRVLRQVPATGAEGGAS